MNIRFFFFDMVPPNNQNKKRKLIKLSLFSFNPNLLVYVDLK